MKIDVDVVSPTQRKIRVELPGDAVKKEFLSVYENLSQRAKIKGFRPGKVPRSVLQGVYGDEVKGQVLTRLVEQSLGEVFKQRGLKVISEPEVETDALEEGRDFVFSAMVEVKPDIEVKDYRGLELKKARLSVDDDQVERTLERIRDAYAQLVPVEDRDVVERGDFLTLDFVGSIDGKPLPGGKSENYSLEVGGGNTLPDFEGALIGLTKGTEHTISVPYPADYFNKELAGKVAQFSVTVREIKNKVLPPLDDEFAKDRGDCSTLEDLKQKIRAQLEAELREFQTGELKEQLIDRLVEAHSFDVPPSMVDRQVRYLLERHQSRQKAQGTAPVGEKPSTEELRKGFQPHAKRQVKATLILEKIAELEKVEVSDSEVQKRVEETARVAGEKAPAVRHYYDRADARENLRSQMIIDRTIDYLLQHAAMKEVEPAVDAQGKNS
ncbi:MAG TPA: trigger factor [Candidatus Binatia bacterium]|jgi:trigger factor